jgi:hypothetical protein
MSILLQILLGVAGIIVLLLIAGLFLKKSFTIETEKTIDRPVQQVFGYIKHIKNQDEYNPWSLMDPAMKKEYSGTDGTVGFISAWESNKPKGPGKGEQEIISIEENKRLGVELRFIKPFASVSPAWFTTDSIDGNKTLVKWGIFCEMKFPMNIMGLFIPFEKGMRKELDKGLAQMKTNLEQ